MFALDSVQGEEGVIYLHFKLLALLRNYGSFSRFKALGWDDLHLL